MKVFSIIWDWICRLWFGLLPKKGIRKRVKIIEGDTPPELISCDNFVLAREDGEDWAIAFLCPCGCKDRLELVLIPEVKPHWVLKLDNADHPTLHPSVWRKTDCGAHFWVKEGRIIWCE